MHRWGGWHKETNKQWVDNCANYVDPSGKPSGCGVRFFLKKKIHILFNSFLFLKQNIQYSLVI